MEIEYSNEFRGKVFAYRFTSNEMVAIADCLPPHVKKLRKKIEKIENDTRNEGQATYACQIEELQREVKDFEEIINEFKKG